MSYTGFNSSNATQVGKWLDTFSKEWTKKGRYEGLTCAVSIITVIICMMGIPGMVMTVWFFYHRKIQQTTQKLLMMLAIYDTLTLIVITPTSILAFWIIKVDQIGGLNVIFSDYYIPNYIMRIPQNSSNTLLLIISIERMISIVMPHKVKNIFNKTAGTIILVTISVMVPLVMAPLAFQYEEVKTYIPYFGRTLTTQQLTQFGQENQTFFKGLQITIFVLFFSIPLLGVVFCNLVVMINLRKLGNIRKSLKSTNQGREMKTTKLMLVVTIIFVIAVTPLGIFMPISKLIETKVSFEVYKVLIPLASLFEAINYSSNCVVYYIGSSVFRCQCRKLFSRFLCCTNRIEPNQNLNENLKENVRKSQNRFCVTKPALATPVRVQNISRTVNPE